MKRSRNSNFCQYRFEHSNRQIRLITTAIFLVALMAGLSTGCGGPSYPLRGTVKYDGKAIKDGSILFEPDKESGNEGPSAQTRIHGGKFSIPAGQPVAPGPVIARITDNDNPELKLIAKFEMPASPTTEFVIKAELDESN